MLGLLLCLLTPPLLAEPSPAPARPDDKATLTREQQTEQLMHGAYLQAPYTCPALEDPQTYAQGTMAAMRQIVAGKRYWYFRTEVDLQSDFPFSDMSRQAFAELVQRLGARGIRLVMMLQPTRGLMQAEALIQPWRGQYPLYRARAAYLQKAQDMRSLGALVTDMAPVLKSPHEQDYFFRRDHHWTPYGARISAIQVAQVMRSDPGLDGIAARNFDTRPDILLRKMGTMNVAVNRLCGNSYGYQWVRGYATVPVDNADDADALFGDVAVPRIALVGTSNSDNRDDRYKNYNFQGFLQQYLHRDVVNYAMTGGGATGSLQDLLYSDAYRDGQFRYVIWELPVNYALEDPVEWRQILPAAGQGCRGRELLASGQAMLPVGGPDQRREVLANAGANRQATGERGALTLDMTFSSAALKDFYVLAYYDDGLREKVRVRRPARLDTGRFMLRLDPPQASSNLISVLLEPEQALTEPVQVESRLCAY
ncbi:alginate biosynthesis protein AlgX [Alcanivorax hongdengensis A-11-3]|uniref:Alginate biosynthesis protein AlgX n=1 Tax=Alcanivorax hongdengensis A-11-3 TaxID=1177179 RepID=L0WE43_9GAMM|nr:alginate biosynthesis protein AlgX [Alcanivorax hongdengensis A-11-3]